MSPADDPVTTRLARLERELAAGEWSAAMATAEGLALELRGQLGGTEPPAALEALRARCERLAHAVEGARSALQADVRHHRRGQRATHAYTSGALAGAD